MTSSDGPGVTDNQTILGLLGELAGEWRGTGLNVVAVPDFENRSNVLLGLNPMADSLSYTPAAVPIVNRGYDQADIEFGAMAYLHKTTDSSTGTSIHLEPGIWINQPATSAPPAETPAGGQRIARMWSITHGSSFVAEGVAMPFSGTPVLGTGADPTDGSAPAFSSFPSFNCTPMQPAFPDPAASVSAAGMSGSRVGSGGGIAEYDLDDAPLPPGITPEVANDPVILLQRTIQEQVAEGYEFEGVALNISTARQISFESAPNPDSGAAVSSVSVGAGQFGGGITSHSFLLGSTPGKPNAVTSLLYATFWIQRLSHPDGRPPLLQLQYAQNALVNFAARNLPGEPEMSWPHVTVATLHRVH